MEAFFEGISAFFKRISAPLCDAINKNPKNYLIGTVVIIVGFLYLFLVENYFKTFVDNVIPELVGVAIELVLIMIALDLIVKKQEKEKNKKIEQRSREYLRFFIINLLKNDSVFYYALNIEPELEVYRNNRSGFLFLSKDKDSNAAIINALIKALINIDTKDIEKETKNHIRIDLPAFHSMTPVVAQVSGKHLKKWGRILYFMSLIENDDSKFVLNMKVILNKIIEFDIETSKTYKV